MDAKVNPQIQSRSGIVPLGAVIGRGGEGAVYEVLNSPDRVVKLYHKPIAAEKAAKIEAMASIRTEALASLTAWPAELLRSSSGDDPTTAMGKAGKRREGINELFRHRFRRNCGL